ncbi:TM2 domain-containing protein [Limimaricola litoreus]|uniref:TM2 domain-containing protein n=1 Tax=Limimaricola litoreus TaxID=2955316 RepID=A0A9X2FT17_9RHOB|nr:TM2 domain-containing protein [Limimaricola litoreus]MCP1169795.1 TM2 domain-containing protein [Limimaricola litoreus]
MALSTQQQILLEQQVTNQSKSVGVAYLLLIFLGGLGAHRFYLGRTASGVAMLLLFILGWLTAIFIVGYLLLIAVGIWWLVDLFLIPGMVARDSASLRSRLSTAMLPEANA